MDKIVDERAVETDPILLPAGSLVRIIGVPLPRKQQEHHPALDRNGLRTSQRLAKELALALGDVQKLVLLKHPSAGHRKDISRRMVARRIVHSRSDFLKADGIDRRPPLEVNRVDRQIFEMYRSHSFQCSTLVVVTHKYSKKLF